MRLQLAGEPAGLLGFRAPLLEGDRGTTQTIKLMRRLVDQALTDQQFIRFAIDLVRDVPAFDDSGEVYRLFSWVQSNIRYTKDPVSKEKLYPPQELLKIRAGDCDDMAMLLGALALALGYQARLITLGANPEYPNEFSHVYAEVEVPPGSGRWMALDTARPGAQFGLEPPVYFRKRAWSLTDDASQEMRGLGAYRAQSTRPQFGGADYDDIVRERLAGLGYDSSGFDWTQFTSQLLTETPAIISATQGKPSSVTLPGGTSVSTGNPYSSFATPYTPGYGVPASGYSLQGASATTFSALLPWILIGVVGIAVFKR